VATILPKWRDWITAQPDEVTALAVAWTAPVSDHLPPPIQGKRVLILGSVYAGDMAMGEKVMEGMRHLGTPLFDMSGPIPSGRCRRLDPFFGDGTVSSY
jgi:hypothetical protein